LNFFRNIFKILVFFYSFLTMILLFCSVVKCSESLSNRVSNVSRRYIDHRKFSAFMAFSFKTFLHVPFCSFLSLWIGFVFCVLLFNSVSYVFLLLCMLCSAYSVSIVPTGILRLPWLRFFRAFSSVLRQMPGHNSQKWVTARTHPIWIIVLFYVLFVSIVLFCVLFVCECALYCCHQVSTQLQLTNISYHTSF